MKVALINGSPKARLGENIFIEPNFPRFAYKLAGEMNWRKAIRASGLRRKDLFEKINVSK